MMELKDLCAGYGGEDRLRHVSLRFQAGCLTGLIGPNGSGKSTLIKACAGQLRPSHGQVLLEGLSIAGMGPRALARRLAYMPQMRGAPAMTVRQLAAHGRYPHLGFGRALSCADWRQVDWALERAGITAYAARPVASLSGGERQRAYLAMLLAQDTPLLLLDEPTAFLDIRHQFSLMDLLQQLAREGKTVVVALHELGLALSYCQRLLLLKDGLPLAWGPPGQVYQSGHIQEAFGVNVIQAAPGQYLFSSRDKS
ncbi:MAG TPA: ABC transporter ATP-binding protein [Candidatus Excrementavichristensenella intestinipullorum]|nr:ABC transporter ATP-binding protein [Candidatus Excrementavichristensenella intestinipullorum]